MARTKKTAQPEPKFRTVNDLMGLIDEEIDSIKDGTLSESKARVVAKNRQMQIQSIELMLAAARIEARFRPALGQRLGLPAMDEPITTRPQ